MDFIGHQRISYRESLFSQKEQQIQSDFQGLEI